MCLETPCLIIYVDRKLSELLDRVDELLTASVKLQKKTMKNDQQLLIINCK